MAWHWWWPWGSDAVAEGEERWRRTGGGQRGRGFWDGPVDPADLMWVPGQEPRGESSSRSRPSGAVSPDVPYVVADGVPLDVYRAALEASTGQCGACWGTGAAEDQLGVGDLGVIPCARCDGTGLWQGGLPDPELVSDADAAALAEQTLAEEWPAEDDDEVTDGEDGDANARDEGDDAEDEAESDDEAAADDAAQGDEAEGDDAGSSADDGGARDGDDESGWGDAGAGEDASQGSDSGDDGDDGGTGDDGSDGGDASGGGGTGQ